MKYYKRLYSNHGGDGYQRDKIYPENYIIDGYMRVGSLVGMDLSFKYWREVSLSDYLAQEGGKKIIGYKAPHDLFQGEIKKGQLYVKDIYTYRPADIVSVSPYGIPKEIVEQWEPVYEEVNPEPEVTVNGCKAEFGKICVKFGCAYIDKQLFLDLDKYIIESEARYLDKGNRALTFVTIGSGRFTIEQVSQIAEYYKKQDGEQIKFNK